MNRKRSKISIIGAGRVGSTIAYTLTISGLFSEIVIVDIDHERAVGEAMDIVQGTAFCPPANLHAGGYENTADSDIIVVTAGVGRKPGQSRIDLAQTNIDILRDIVPKVVPYAPYAVYIVVSNPVDIMTYATLRLSGLPNNQVIGSGTMLDTTRLRTALAARMEVNPHDVQAFVLGEHGDTAVVPWSLTSIAGMGLETYCDMVFERHGYLERMDLDKIVEEVLTAGAKVIERKGATYYAISLSVQRICEVIMRNSNSLLTVSCLTHGQHGLGNLCLSLPYVIGANGVVHEVPIILTPEEELELQKSAEALKAVIDTIKI